jgi:hypothetical protein
VIEFERLSGRSARLPAEAMTRADPVARFAATGTGRRDATDGDAQPWVEGDGDETPHPGVFRHQRRPAPEERPHR